MRIKRKLAEIWEPVLNCKKYEVSSLGRVRFSTDKIIIEPVVGTRGYLVINNRLVHRMVLETFHGPRPFPGAECRHLDGNKENNRENNLCWGTARENYEDKVRHGTAFSSPEIRAKLSASHMGKPLSEEHRKSLSIAGKLCENPGKFQEGHDTSEEVRQKLRETNTGRTMPPNIRQKIAESMKGNTNGSGPRSEEFKNKMKERIISPEIGKKISEAKTGKPLSEEHKAAISKSHTGKKLSEEHKAKIGLAGVGREKSEETRKKLSEPLKGILLSPEHKEALKRGWEKRREREAAQKTLTPAEDYWDDI